MTDSTKSRCQDGVWGSAPVCPKCLESSGMVQELKAVDPTKPLDWEQSYQVVWRCICGEKRD